MRARSPRAALAPLLLSVCTLPAAAQQFQQSVGLIPGPARWTEGVECADVDRDGDLDLFFADGEGFAGAGTQRQNVLLVNRRVETGSLSFADESVARLGAHLSNAKGVTTADVDGDGWVDALFANAFNTDRPFLYVNRGAAQPGFFDEDGSARGLTTTLSSASAQFGDLDDDGDLDLVICDSGSSFLGGAGGKPRLYRNDGTGHFTEDASALAAPTKRAQMDVQLVDVDGDWDLDFFGACRASNAGGNHFLLINDGTGHFSDASSSLPATSSNVYEAELGDLDGDDDLDLFFVSVSGFQEGAVRNDGGLSFASTGALPGFVDDNEIALCDYDDDGDLDPFVGSLGATEVIWRNDGGFSFVDQGAQVQSVTDSTLDIAIGDLDLDGDYDLITAQGESNALQWGNKVFLNGGAKDTRAPVVVATADPAALDSASGPWIAKAKVRDAVIDDGVTYVAGEARFVVLPAPLDLPAQVAAGGFVPAALSIAPGTVVTWTNTSGAPQSVTGQTAPYLFDSGSIPAGGTYARAFVHPGSYGIVSTPSGFTLTVTVTAGGATAPSLATGRQHRFAMSGDASASTARLVYELFFSDFAGNETVTEPRIVEQGALPPPTYCFGDGTGTPCPCGNAGGLGRGCANGFSGQGSLLGGFGSLSVTANLLTLAASGLAPNQPGLYFQGDNRIAGGAGAMFGDGLRCAGGGVVRIEIAIADAGGVSFTTVDVAAKTGVLAGETKRYQLWYRDPAGSPCGSGFNLTNGLELVWVP